MTVCQSCYHWAFANAGISTLNLGEGLQRQSLSEPYSLQAPPLSGLSWALFRCSGIRMQTEKGFQEMFPQNPEISSCSIGASRAKDDFPTRDEKNL